MNINKTECADFEARFCCPKLPSISEYTTTEATSMESTIEYSTNPSFKLPTPDTIIDSVTALGTNFSKATTMIYRKTAMKTVSLATESKKSETTSSTTKSGPTSEATSDASISEIIESETMMTPSSTASYSFKRWSFENNNLTHYKPSSIDDLRIFINFKPSVYGGYPKIKQNLSGGDSSRVLICIKTLN